MTPGEIVAFIGGVLLILGVIWRLIRAIYRLTRVGETALVRLTAVEEKTEQVAAQLQNNGGNSARDILDNIHEQGQQIHAVAVENAEANARVERGQQRAAALAASAEAKADQAARFAGQTGIVASRTEQRLQELAATTDVRHAENTARLDALESNDEDAKIQREFLLHLLRTKHGIDLIDDEDDEASDSDGAT